MSNTSTKTSEPCTLVCANCGKESNDVTNTCNKCNSVMYCNAACKKKHRHKHKKECERRVAELHDEKLFEQPPPLEDCPICFLRLPTLATGRSYNECCGKVICRGCIHTVQFRAVLAGKQKENICPFCRTPPPSDKEKIKRHEKRIELNDPRAICNLGCFYSQGLNGLPRNIAKALELWHRAGELGCAAAYYCIGIADHSGLGVEEDKKKSIYYWELAAMKGHVAARYNLGAHEFKAGNMNRALRHYMIAVRDGESTSLKNIKLMYKNRDVTKGDYVSALRAYQAHLDEIKSVQRDEAAAFKEEYKYYGRS